jgi:nucleoside-diphosphate-sugar epimerase
MTSLAQYLRESKVKNIIYISSTSIYPDLNKEVKEEDVLRLDQAGNAILFKSEEIFRKETQWNTLIIRCAGLAGYDRNLVRYFAGKRDLPMGDAPVNLIHRDDVIGIIYKLIVQDKWNETYNISAPEHPLRKDLYPDLAVRYGFEAPTYNAQDNSPFKIISIAKMMNDLAYSFKFTNPADFFYTSRI